MHKIDDDKPSYNPDNERVKEKYFRMLKNAGQMGAKTIRIIANAIRRFEKSTGFRDFKKFKVEDAVAFKVHLDQAPGRRGGTLSVGAKVAMLTHLSTFFEWLSRERGYRKYIDTNDTAYFKPSLSDMRATKSPTVKDAPTLAEILIAVRAMPTTTEIERRNRAMVAMTILTGMRDAALISLRLRHVRLDKDLVLQDPKTGVKTKNSKAIFSFFYPVDPMFKEIVIEWVNEMASHHGPDQPVFPRTKMKSDEVTTNYAVAGLDDQPWTNTGHARKIFRAAFESAGLRYYKPHLFRDTLTHLMLVTCKTFEEMKAWSQNLGHRSLETTLGIYATIKPDRQGVLLKALSEPKVDPDTDRALETAIAALNELKKRK
jgi:integrase